MKLKMEYIWLDGNNPQQLRSKTKIIEFSQTQDQLLYQHRAETVSHVLNLYRSAPNMAPIWNFDGSSTSQAKTSKSELLLKPVNFFINPFIENSILVLCEVLYTDMKPHYSNTRNKMVESVNRYDDSSLYGYEQEYFIYDKSTKKPLGWPKKGNPKEQGDYYCGVGSLNVGGRDFVEEHTDLCLKAGLLIGGTNAEVALGQWEYQIGPVPAIDGSDQLWISRYILHRLSEKYNYSIELDPKPIKGDMWNGSGMHVNFSTKTLREDKVNKKQIAIQMCKKLESSHEDHIKVYGVNNEHRLTGKNETSSMNNFGWGIGDRTKSIRIPSSINDDNSIGYIEDRRPASNACPYLIVDKLLRTLCHNEIIVDL